jgi:hypothetical protein
LGRSLSSPRSLRYIRRVPAAVTFGSHAEGRTTKPLPRRASLQIFAYEPNQWLKRPSHARLREIAIFQ